MADADFLLIAVSNTLLNNVIVDTGRPAIRRPAVGY
jgi:hypothetical protein